MTETKNVSNATSKRNAAIDGMRALAIIGIVAFHMRPVVLTGGFLGVTMFLVLAGYFCTMSLLKIFDSYEIEESQNKSKSLSYFKYIFRRIKRIWPSALATIVLSVPLMWLFSPSLLTKLQSDALTSASFTSNMAYILRKVSYFEQSGLPSPIKHFWYLGLVMQIFICWPIILWIILKIIKSKFARICITAILMIASALLNIAITLFYAQGETVARVYYSPDTRASEFLVGAILAMYCAWFSEKSPLSIIEDASKKIFPKSKDLKNKKAILTSAISIFAIIFVCWCFIKEDGSKAWIVYGGYTIFAIVCAILMWSCIKQNNVCTRILSTAPLSYLGRRSFAIYVVHFPILEVLNPATRTTHITIFEQILQCVIVVAAGEVFYRIFEMPLANRNMTFSINSVSAKSKNVKDENANLDLSSDTLSVKSKNIRLPFVLRRMATFVCFALCLALIVVPLDWNSIAQARAIQLRPELAAKEQNVKSQAKNTSQSNNANQNKKHAKIKQKVVGKRKNIAKKTLPTKPSPYRVLNPIAEKVPENINTKPWRIDSKRNICTANITMIGDSVTEGAKPYLMQVLPNAWIDGKVSRQIFHGAEEYQQDAGAKHPGSVVIYELGTNGPPRDESVLQNMVNVTGGKPVYFVTTRVPQPWQDVTNARLRDFASKHKNVGIIDWYGLSAGHSEFLTDDGVHLTPIGGPQYARMIRLAVCGG